MVIMVDISNYIETLKNAIYGEEVRGALIALAEGFNDRISDGIFVADYGTTTHAELLAAVAAGKIVYAVRGDLPYILVQVPTPGGTRAAFARVANNGYQIAMIFCSSANVWSNSAYTLATQAWVTSRINAAIDNAITAAIEGSY